MIFYKVGTKSQDKKTGKDLLYDLESKINFSVFPGHQGGPHNHTIAALTVALGEANTPEFKAYQKQVLLNSKIMAKCFIDMKYKIVTDGTDNHLILIDLASKGLDGARVESVLENVNIYVNKNTIPGNKSALIPTGMRLGSPAMTSRGFEEADFEKVAEYVDRGVEITKRLKSSVTGTKLTDFKTHLAQVKDSDAEILKLKEDVSQYMEKFEFVY